ncbi:hypothetical protein ABPG75_010395 [Micractinium tetrahymenae]
MQRSLACLLAVALLLGAAPAPASAGVLDSISQGLKNAWGAVWTSLSGLAQTVECKAVDWAKVSLSPCLLAPADNLCTADCQSNLVALAAAGQACIDKMIADVAQVGNTTATDRWEEQLTACNITFTVPNAAAASARGSVLLPLAVLTASMLLLELLRP